MTKIFNINDYDLMDVLKAVRALFPDNETLTDDLHDTTYEIAGYKILNFYCYKVFGTQFDRLVVNAVKIAPAPSPVKVTICCWNGNEGIKTMSFQDLAQQLKPYIKD